MPTVPKYERTQVTPQPVAPMRTPDVSREVEAIGKAKAAPLDIASRVIQDEVKRGKQMAVENYKLQVAKAHAELQNKLLAKQRKDAIAGADEAINDWDKVEADLGSIPLSDVRNEVLQYANQKKVELASTAARHAQAETQRMATEDYQAGINLAVNNAMINADSPEHLALNRDEIISNTANFADLTGMRTKGTPEETAAFRSLVTHNLTQLHSAVIEQMADSGNIEGAKFAFEQAKKDPELDAKAILALNDKLKASERKHEDDTFKLATELMYEAVRKGNVDPNPRDVVGPDLLTQLPPEKVRALENWRNPPFTSDNTIVPHIYDMWTNNTPALATMKYSDLKTRYFSKLSEQDWNTVQGLWRGAQGVMSSTGQTGEKAGQKAASPYPWSSYIDKVLVDNNYIPADPKNRSEYDRERSTKVGLAVGPMLNAADAEKRKKGLGKLSDQEVVDIVKKAVAETVRQRTRGFDKDISMIEALSAPKEHPVYVPMKDIDALTSTRVQELVSEKRGAGFKIPDTAYNRRIQEQLAAVVKMWEKKLYTNAEADTAVSALVAQLKSEGQ